jgi:hypothetical protein
LAFLRKGCARQAGLDPLAEILDRGDQGHNLFLTIHLQRELAFLRCACLTRVKVLIAAEQVVWVVAAFHEVQRWGQEARVSLCSQRCL